MDRPLAGRAKPNHLICRTGWALLLTAACAYFAYRTFVDIRIGHYDWQHTWWDTLTWFVWMVLAAGAISEVRCWREWLLFCLLFLQFLLGCVFSVWTSASFDFTREIRWLSLFLWTLTAALGVVVLFGPGKKGTTGFQVHS